MTMKMLVAAAAVTAALAAATLAVAQTPAAGTASSAAKKQLVARVLELQKPGIESLGANLAAAPALQMRQQAGIALQQAVAPERREAVAREIEGDLRKYIEDVGPTMRDRAVRLAPATVGAMLEERFTEDELKQLVALLESPVNRKFQAVAPEMQRALGERLIGETRATMEPKVRELEQTIARRLGLPGAGGAASAPAR